jgi:hypothetical protein
MKLAEKMRPPKDGTIPSLGGQIWASSENSFS